MSVREASIMKVVVYLLGLFYIGIGSFPILYSRETMDFMRNLYREYQLKYLAAIPVVIGLLFLISAPSICYPWILRLISLLAFCEAVLAFTNPQKIFTRLLDWYFGEVSVRTVRLYGIIAIILRKH